MADPKDKDRGAKASVRRPSDATELSDDDLRLYAARDTWAESEALSLALFRNPSSSQIMLAWDHVATCSLMIASDVATSEHCYTYIFKNRVWKELNDPYETTFLSEVHGLVKAVRFHHPQWERNFYGEHGVACGAPLSRHPATGLPPLRQRLQQQVPKDRWIAIFKQAVPDFVRKIIHIGGKDYLAHKRGWHFTLKEAGEEALNHLPSDVDAKLVRGFLMEFLKDRGFAKNGLKHLAAVFTPDEGKKAGSRGKKRGSEEK